MHRSYTKDISFTIFEIPTEWFAMSYPFIISAKLLYQSRLAWGNFNLQAIHTLKHTRLIHNILMAVFKWRATPTPLQYLTR